MADGGSRPRTPATNPAPLASGDVKAAVGELFDEAMASLAAGVCVVTARRADGDPCGLAATSVSSYSADPPSLLVSIAHESRCHGALAA